MLKSSLQLGGKASSVSFCTFATEFRTEFLADLHHLKNCSRLTEFSLVDVP